MNNLSSKSTSSRSTGSTVEMKKFADEKGFITVPKVCREGHPDPATAVEQDIPSHNLHADEKAEKAVTYLRTTLSSVGLSLSSFMTTPSNKSWTFRLTRFASLTTNGSGGLAIVTTVQPSQFMQYTSVNALFRECRLIKTKITYTPKVAPDTASLLNGIMHTAFDANSIGTDTITTSDEVDRHANSKIFNCNTTALRTSNHFKCPRGRPWSLVNASSGGSDPVGGISGGWLHLYTNASYASTNVADYLIEAWYEFRNMH